MSDAQDAARYRWIRSCFRIGQHGEWVAIVNDPVNALDESQFDRQIDSAMREDAAKSERAAENNDAGAGDDPVQSAPPGATPASPPLANAAADTRTRGRRRNDATDQSV